MCFNSIYCKLYLFPLRSGLITVYQYFKGKRNNYYYFFLYIHFKPQHFLVFYLSNLYLLPLLKIVYFMNFFTLHSRFNIISSKKRHLLIDVLIVYTIYFYFFGRLFILNLFSSFQIYCSKLKRYIVYIIHSYFFYRCFRFKYLVLLSIHYVTSYSNVHFSSLLILLPFAILLTYSISTKIYTLFVYLLFGL